VARPLVIEVVGPAGSGKSTVARLLTARAGVARAGVWGLPRPLLTASVLRTLPATATLLRRSRALPLEEMMMLVRLDALAQFLRRKVNGDLIVLDEGPVFGLSWLRVAGHRCISDGRFDGWWRHALDHWADVLHAIVMLDAPDPLLARRIYARTQPHRYKGRPEPEFYEFSAVFRSAFDWVLAGLAARGGPRVVTLASDGVTPGELAHRICAALEEPTHAD